MQRRLAAILAADVVGFSALVGQGEERTIRALKAHLATLEPMIALHSGRIFKTTGDGFLAEFGSVVDAVSCADAMQKQMAARNADEDPASRLEFRMGVHAGDVVIDGEDMLGDGVNIAARLEGVAGPGGVAVSARVHDDVAGKLDIAFEDLGPTALKNIAAPVHVYAIGPRKAAARTARIALPDKPSVAVLPFANMSAAAEDDYFADGVTEDIITALAYVPWIFVIARNSSFSYKGLSVDVRKIGRELGVRYVLEGSVRRSGPRLRVTGQLIDAETGAHIWAERYDGVVEDVFDLQDRISEAVVTAIAPEIQSAEIQRGLRKPPENLDAYDMCLRGQNALHRGRLEEADDWLTRAIDAAPDFAKARALKAWIGTLSHLYGESPVGERRQGYLALAEDALARRPDDPEVVAYAGYAVGFLDHDPRRGLALVEQATARCPSFAWAWASSSMLSAYLGLADQALERADIALRLSPRDPLAFRIYIAMSIANIMKGDAQAHLDCSDKGVALNPRSLNFHYHRAIALTELGRLEEAAAARSRALEMTPDFRIGSYIRYVLGGIGVAEALARRLEDGLRKAGFPE